MAYCERCDRYFRYQGALDQHEQNSDVHNICNGCGIDFSTWLGLKEHWVQSGRHFYCQHCNEHLQDDDALMGHYHNYHWFCEPCRKILKSELGLHEHNRQSHHYCVECKKVFQSASNLNSVSLILLLYKYFGRLNLPQISH